MEGRVRQDRKATRGTKFRSLQTEIAGISDDLTSLGAALGATTSDEARAVLQSIRQKADRVAGSVGEATTENVTALEDVIEENPLGSIAVALAAGFILGTFVHR